MSSDFTDTNRQPRGIPRESDPLVEVRDVEKHFTLDDSVIATVLGTKEFVRAVDGISLTIYQGETFALVGESGSGKSTLANLVTGLQEPTNGEIRFDGQLVGSAISRDNDVLSDIGMVFQNPKSSIDPRMTVRSAIAEPLKAEGWNTERRQQRIDELIELVNLSEEQGSRYPHELSGGQAQRVAIARAIALDPQLLVLDEPVSALDISIQAKILNLLMRLQNELDLTYLFIAHDLSVIEHIADRVAVMYLGQIMELASAEHLYEKPTHPYTATLLSAIPEIVPGNAGDHRVILEGDVPSPVDPPNGCVFHTRCPIAEEKCQAQHPDLDSIDNAQSRCHFSQEFAEEGFPNE